MHECVDSRQNPSGFELSRSIQNCSFNSKDMAMQTFQRAPKEQLPNDQMKINRLRQN